MDPGTDGCTWFEIITPHSTCTSCTCTCTCTSQRACQQRQHPAVPGPLACKMVAVSCIVHSPSPLCSSTLRTAGRITGMLIEETCRSEAARHGAAMQHALHAQPLCVEIHPSQNGHRATPLNGPGVCAVGCPGGASHYAVSDCSTDCPSHAATLKYENTVCRKAADPTLTQSPTHPHTLTIAIASHTHAPLGANQPPASRGAVLRQCASPTCSPCFMNANDVYEF